MPVISPFVLCKTIEQRAHLRFTSWQMMHQHTKDLTDRSVSATLHLCAEGVESLAWVTDTYECMHSSAINLLEVPDEYFNHQTWCSRGDLNLNTPTSYAWSSLPSRQFRARCAIALWIRKGCTSTFMTTAWEKQPAALALPLSVPPVTHS